MTEGEIKAQHQEQEQQEAHPLREARQENARRVLELGQKFIDANQLLPDETGFFRYDVPMESYKNPDGETFIQACGFLSMEGIEGVYFPEPEEEELSDEFPTPEQIMKMSKSRKVAWNPEILSQFLAT